MLRPLFILFVATILLCLWGVLLLIKGIRAETETAFRFLYATLAIAITAGAAFAAFLIVIANPYNPFFLPLPNQSPLENVGAAFLLVAIFAAAWALYGQPAKGSRRCPKCPYDMRGISTRTCPECGHEAKNEKALFKTRRPRARFAITAVLLLVSLTTFGYGRYQRGGLAGLFPTTVIIAALPSMPDEVLLHPGATAIQDMTLLQRVYDDELYFWQQQWLVPRFRATIRTNFTIEWFHRSSEILFDSSIQIFDADLLDRVAEELIRIGPNPTKREAALIGMINYAFSLEPFKDYWQQLPKLTPASKRQLAAHREDIFDLYRSSNVLLSSLAEKLIWCMDEEALPLMPALIDDLAGPHPFSTRAFGTLAPFADRHESVAAQLETALRKRNDKSTRDWILFIYARGSLPIEPIAPLLIEWVRTDNQYAARAAGTLARRDWQPDTTLPLIIDSVATSHIRAEVFGALSWAEADDLASVWPRIAEFKDDPDAYIRDTVTEIAARLHKWQNTESGAVILDPQPTLIMDERSRYE